MLCQNCNNATATTYIKKSINGVTKEYNLCQKCAMKLGLGDYNFFDTDDLFGSLLNIYNQNTEPMKICENCKSSYDDIIKKGRLGCPDCYTTFYNELAPSIVKMQGKLMHTGIKPNKQIIVEDDIIELEKDLKKAILNEEYEKAAQIRDILKEKRGEKNG